jgi:hypothetical protein
MTRTRLTAVAFGLAAVCTAGLAAQTQETQTTTKTKIEIKGGKNVTVTGCLEQRSNGDYVLADARDSRERTVAVRTRHQPGLVQARGRARRNQRQGCHEHRRQGLDRIEDQDRGRKRRRPGNAEQERRHERRVQHAVSRRPLDQDALVVVPVTTREFNAGGSHQRHRWRPHSRVRGER